MASTVQFIGGATTGANNTVDKSYNQAAPATNDSHNQEYQISNDASFAADDIPF
jgi:hypothetical protein